MICSTWLVRVGEQIEHVVVSEELEDVVEGPTATGVGRPPGGSTELLGQRVDVNELLEEYASGVEHINLERVRSPRTR